MLCGDEFWNPISKNVFDSESISCNTWISQGIYDLSEFITSLNEVLEYLPSSNPEYWVEVLNIEAIGRDDCFFAVVQEGPGYNKKNKLIVVNLGKEIITINGEIKEQLAIAAGHIQEEKGFIFQEGYENVISIFTNRDNILMVNAEMSLAEYNLEAK